MRITVQVKPGSKKGPLVEEIDGQLTVFVPERAVDGKANDAVLKLLAEHLGTRPKNLTLESGFTSKIKRFRLDES
jgi:uncharacterized protein YggU (UPF0235/DUF167 family)